MFSPVFPLKQLEILPRFCHTGLFLQRLQSEYQIKRETGERVWKQSFVLWEMRKSENVNMKHIWESAWLEHRLGQNQWGQASIILVLSSEHTPSSHPNCLLWFRWQVSICINAEHNNLEALQHLQKGIVLKYEHYMLECSLHRFYIHTGNAEVYDWVLVKPGSLKALH